MFALKMQDPRLACQSPTYPGQKGTVTRMAAIVVQPGKKPNNPVS
jgi:hypothetical protein